MITLICGNETGEKVVLKNYSGRWECVRDQPTASGAVNGTLRGGPYDGMSLADLPEGAIVYVNTSPVISDSTGEPADGEDSSPTGFDATAIDKAVSWAMKIANDDSHGYSQSVRWGPSYDCSSFVISAWEQAGVPVKTKGATYTGNMYGVFLSCGFRDVTHQVHLSDGRGIVKGDVLLTMRSHTVMSIGNGKVVAARSSNGTSNTIDDNGSEITTQNYYNYPSGWDYVLRYGG